MASPTFITSLRTQYSYVASQCELIKVLAALAEASINVLALNLKQQWGKSFNVDMVLGPVDNGSKTISKKVVAILKRLEINYQVRTVSYINIPTLEIPGTYLRIITAITPRVKIYQFYGAENGIIIDSSHPADVNEMVSSL